ncbi:sialic acid synthase-like isoform X2 [Limulus polyphemus]|uniref:Sialic acid synthase-like isoform X2 n=1 Tax=Limulus polyphemus TaxID=6850 RepID=A0ABM1T8M2_LIMPO|nr:sialic acid synthase-like isoform X2 [Limulus polyphemus]
MIKKCGANCVKFQKSDLNSRFNKAALDRPYTSHHSWGNTYGQHRAHLEFSESQFKELKKHAERHEIIFSASGMDMVSLRFLNQLGVPFFKIGSGDANNYSLIQDVARFGKPLIVSTGMQSIDTVQKVYYLLKQFNIKLGFLHCVSAYPAPPSDINLRVIQSYQEKFPDVVIGYSGHETGTDISIAAVALGAKILERHLTLDKTWKGSDHCASLDPEEFQQLVSQVRNVETALGSHIKIVRESEIACYRKLGKTLVASQNLQCGTVLSEDMLDIKVSEPKGLNADQFYNVIGHTLIHDKEYDDSIFEEDIS